MAGPGLIQGDGDFHGNDLDFDDDVFLGVCWRLCGKGWPSPISNYIKTLSSNSRNGGLG